MGNVASKGVSTMPSKYEYHRAAGEIRKRLIPVIDGVKNDLGIVFLGAVDEHGKQFQVGSPYFNVIEREHLPAAAMFADSANCDYCEPYFEEGIPRHRCWKLI
jgi:hypothetical protein